MNKTLAIALFAFLLRSDCAFTNEGARALDLSGYRMTFEDRFDKLSISAWGPGTRWIAHTPWNGDFGDAAFADPEPGFPFAKVDGRLNIEARKGADGKWRSGMIASTDPEGRGFSQALGYFEMRAKLPSGPGLWPAFWLIGNKAPSEGSAEIDVMEYLGHDPSKYEATVHVWPRNGAGRNYQSKFVVPAPTVGLADDFHTYGVSVDADEIVFYLDSKEVARTPTPPEHRQKLFLLVSLAMGSGFSTDKTPNPSSMIVDYVRAYEKL